MQFSDLAVVFPLERKKRFYYDLIYESTDILPLKGLCLCGPLFKNKYKKGAALKWQRLFTRPPAEHGDQEDGGWRHNDFVYSIIYLADDLTLCQAGVKPNPPFNLR